MLKIEHISKTFNPGTVNEKQAIRDLSLNLEKGDFATIIGSNGAGKSTLFNAICGDFLTDSGVIMLDGQDITFMPQHVRAKTIGRLYQDPMRGTAPGMTIEENLALAAGKGGWLSHVSRQEKERFHEELKLLDIGLEKRMTQPVGLLSGGQRQALPFAVYIIFTYPGIFCHHSCFLAEIVIIFSYLLPALCHGGIAEEIVFFSILSKPLPSNCHAGFIKVIGIFISCSPAITEHGTIFTIIIVFVAGTFHPPGETFAVGNTVVIITFILKRTADQTPL